MFTEVVPHPDKVQGEPVGATSVVASDMGCTFLVYLIGVDRISKPMSLTSTTESKSLWEMARFAL